MEDVDHDAIDPTELDDLLTGLTDRLRDGRRRLLVELLRRGYTKEQLREAVLSNRLAVLMLDDVLAQSVSLSARDVAQACALDPSSVARTSRLLGMRNTSEDDVVFDDSQCAAFAVLGHARQTGMSEESIDAIVGALRQHLWELASNVLLICGDEFARPGDTEYELAHRYEDAARMLLPSAGPLVAGVLPVYLRERMRENFVTAEEAEFGSLRAVTDVAVAFVDVVGFTELSQRVEAGQLKSIAGRLVDAAHSVLEPPVRLIKTIGDAILLMSRDTVALVDALLRLFPIVDAEPDVPAVHAGLASGPAYVGGADVYGATVNLASRLTDLAPAGRIWAHDAVAAACPDRGWASLGHRHIRGLHDPVSLFELWPDPAPMRDG